MKWNARKEEYVLAAAIALRANKTVPQYSLRDAEMDIMATHKNGCSLQLAELLAAPDFDFIHDILGIRTNLDRDTGRLKNFFAPRYSVSQGGCMKARIKRGNGKTPQIAPIPQKAGKS